MRPRDAIPGLVDHPGNRVPPAGRTAIFTARDGIRLRSALWPHRGGRQRGTVLLLQGRADHIEKYFEVVGELRERGFAVATFDWRGQGGSERLHRDPLRGHVADMDDYQHDLDAFMATVIAPGAGPLLGLAHSMGGAVLLRALARRPSLVSGAVLTAPMVALSPWLAPPLAAPAVRLACAAGLASTRLPDPRAIGEAAGPFRPDNVLTSDRHRFERIRHVNRQAPHLVIARPTLGWVRAAYGAMAAFGAPTFARAVRTPVLAVAGGCDNVTSTPACAALIARIPGGRMREIETCRHEVMLEADPVRQQFWQAFDSFTDRW